DNQVAPAVEKRIAANDKCANALLSDGRKDRVEVRFRRGAQDTELLPDRLRCRLGPVLPAMPLMPLELLDADQYAGRSLYLSVSEVEAPLRGKTMPTEHKSGRGNSAHRVEISQLVQVYGVTRDQARRLLSRIGNDRAKLGEAARILKAR